MNVAAYVSTGAQQLLLPRRRPRDRSRGCARRGGRRARSPAPPAGSGMPSCSKPTIAAPRLVSSVARGSGDLRSPSTSARICGQTREEVSAVPVATSRVTGRHRDQLFEHLEELVADRLPGRRGRCRRASSPGAGPAIDRARVGRIVGAALAGEERQHRQAVRVRRRGGRCAPSSARLSSSQPERLAHPRDEVAAVAERAADDDPPSIEPVAPQPERHRRRACRSSRSSAARPTCRSSARRGRRSCSRAPTLSSAPSAAAGIQRASRSCGQRRAIAAVGSALAVVEIDDRAELFGRDVARVAQLRIPPVRSVVQEHARCRMPATGSRRRGRASAARR